MYGRTAAHGRTPAYPGLLPSRVAARRRRPQTVLFLFLLLPLLLTLASCTGGPGGGGPSGGVPSRAEASGEIVVASGRDVTGKNGIRQQLIDAWNARQGSSGWSARLVELPGSADEQRSQLLGALQSGSARYDVVNLDVTWVPEFAEAGLIRPLGPEAVADPGDVIPAVAATADWRGERYSVPFNSDVGLLYYRRDYLARAGVRQTDLSRGVGWDELHELIDQVDADPPPGYEAGWTTQLAGYEGRTVNAVEAFASARPASPLTDEDGHYRAGQDDLWAGLTELWGRTVSDDILDHAFTSDEAATLSDFADGRTAFLRHWPYAYRTLHQTFSEAQLGVTTLPGAAVLGGQNLAVTSSSPRARKAAELIRFLTDADSERCLLDAGFAATRLSAYRDDRRRCTHVAEPSAPSASPSATGEATDRMPRDKAGRPAYAVDILLPALQHAVQRPRTPLYGAFTQTFIAELDAVFTRHTAPDEKLVRHVDEALRRALPD